LTNVGAEFFPHRGTLCCSGFSVATSLPLHEQEALQRKIKPQRFVDGVDTPDLLLARQLLDSTAQVGSQRFT
jgi:hypothetical protein